MSKIYKYLPPTRFYSSVPDGDGGHLQGVTKKMVIFSGFDKKSPFTQNFAKQPNIFFVP